MQPHWFSSRPTVFAGGDFLGKWIEYYRLAALARLGGFMSKSRQNSIINNFRE
jgi:hypothetical protein